MLLEWYKSWCLKTHSSTAGRRDLAGDRSLVVLACTHKTAVDLTQCGVLSTKPHLLLDVLPTCLHVMNCPLRKDMGDQKKSRLCESIFKYHNYLWGFIFLQILKCNHIFNCMVVVISEFTVYSTLVQASIFRSCFVFKAKEWKADNTQEPDMHQMHGAHQLSQSKSFGQVGGK